MKQLRVEKFLRSQYKRLEQSETKVRRKLNKIYTVYNATLNDIIYSIFNICITKDYTNYSKLFQSISHYEAIELEHFVNQVKRQINSELYSNDFPFNVMSFDKLNRMEYTKARIIVLYTQLAIEIDEIIKDHLVDYCDDLLIRLEEYLDLYDAEKIASILAYIAVDREYPIEKSVYKNCIHIATQVSERIKQSIIRAENAGRSAKNITKYAEKMVRGSTERLLYRQGTRVTTQSVSDYIKPYIAYFYTVTMKDAKVCQTCNDIALIQKYRPVPISLLKTGTNAPPFHPFCRCGIEVIYYGES